MLTDSKLGFGLMRLPKDEKDNIQIERVCEMVDAYLENGFNYFDTAYVYAGSEEAMRKALVERHPREKYTIADKLPVWELKRKEDAQRVFEESLERCGVAYFDFYLLHSITADHYPIYEKYECFDFILKKKEEGKIRHAGFSYHDGPQLLDEILTRHPEMEFVQLQINYLDWESETVRARENYETVRKHGKEVIIMEPVKGGTLAKLPDSIEGLLRKRRPDASMASWAIRYAASLEGVAAVLSGMSDETQMEDNLKTMKDFEKLDEREQELIKEAVEMFLAIPSIPCTGCRYCVKGCPKKIEIPDLFTAYNESKKYGPEGKIRELYEKHTQGENNKAGACVACGQCENVCPQHLKVIDLLKEVAQVFEG